MNKLYIDYLSKDKMKIDVFLSEANKRAIKLGSCDVLLSELVFSEVVIADSLAHKPAVIEKYLNIVPDPQLTGMLS